MSALTDTPELHAAFVAGLLLALLSLALGRRVAPRAVVVAVAGAVVGLARPAVWSWPVAIGIALAAAGVTAVAVRRPAAAAVGAIPGALVMAVALPSLVPGWVAVLSAAIVVVGTALVGAVERLEPRVAIALMAVSAAGLFAAVPDTEHAAALLGGTAAAALLVLSPRRASSMVAVALWTGVFAWATAVGGSPRPPTLVGGFGCLGVLVVLPLLGPLGRRLLTGIAGPVVLIGAQCAAVAITSRVATRRPTPGAALVLVVAVACALAAVLAAAAWILQHRRPAASSA